MADTIHKYKETVISSLHSDRASMQEVAAALKIPPEEERQPDLQYLTAVFVSSGMNKNGAVFLGSELIKARGSIPLKAVDIEHDERTVVGHITTSAFVSPEGASFSADEVATQLSLGEMDKLDMDVAISAVIHKARFPELADEIAAGDWMVSMECFYEDFDVKVGDLIVPREKAAKLGYDKLVGERVLVKNNDKEIGFQLVGRVLRNITFAGVGLVKNPANERSVIMEAAALNEYVNNCSRETAKVINLAAIESIEDASSKVVPEKEQSTLADEVKGIIKDAVKEALSTKPEENKETAVDMVKPGVCVNFRKYVYDVPGYTGSDLEEPQTDLTQFPLTHVPGGSDSVPPGSRVVRENYCSLFDLDCTARPGDATHPDCWRNVFARKVREEVDSYEEVLRRRRIDEGLVELQSVLDKARTLIR